MRYDNHHAPSESNNKHCRKCGKLISIPPICACFAEETNAVREKPDGPVNPNLTSALKIEFPNQTSAKQVELLSKMAGNSTATPRRPRRLSRGMWATSIILVVAQVAFLATTWMMWKKTERKLSEARLALSEVVTQKEQAGKEVKDLKDKRDLLKINVDELTARTDDLEQEISDKESQLKNVSASLVDKESQLKDLNKRRDNLYAEIARGEKTRLRDASLAARLESQKRELTRINARIQQLNEEVRQKQQMAKNLQKQIDGMRITAAHANGGNRHRSRKDKPSTHTERPPQRTTKQRKEIPVKGKRQ